MFFFGAVCSFDGTLFSYLSIYLVHKVRNIRKEKRHENGRKLGSKEGMLTDLSRHIEGTER